MSEMSVQAQSSMEREVWDVVGFGPGQIGSNPHRLKRNQLIVQGPYCWLSQCELASMCCLPSFERYASGICGCT